MGLREHHLKNRHRHKNPHPTSAAAAETAGGVGHVSRDLRATAKRTPAVKSWLRVLEEPVRAFVVERGLAVAPAIATADNGEGGGDETDMSDDEEIVFVGRNGRVKKDGDLAWKKAQRQQKGDGAVEKGMVLEMGDGEGGAFRRWLTHSISDYYGLDSKSVMVGNPAKRVIYVGAKQKQIGLRHKPPSQPVLPPPLWEML
ncbi:hypothetical protein VTI74DRAFT_2500 [Chaetomium olivicolor]